MDAESYYTLSVFTENKIGLLCKLTIVLTRRRLNIESICVSESELPGIHRYTIVIKTSAEAARKVTAQILKLVEVLWAVVHREDEIVHQEIALFKLPSGPSNRKALENILQEADAKVLTVEKEFFVIQKVGHRPDLQLLYNQLKPFGILEFASSGRVVITKPMKELSVQLGELMQVNP